MYSLNLSFMSAKERVNSSQTVAFCEIQEMS